MQLILILLIKKNDLTRLKDSLLQNVNMQFRKSNWQILFVSYQTISLVNKLSKVSIGSIRFQFKKQ